MDDTTATKGMPKLNSIVEIFHREGIISRAIRENLYNEIEKGSVNSVKVLLSKMEELSFHALPEHSKAFFLPDNYIIVPPHSERVTALEVLKPYESVIHYLVTEKIIGEACSTMLEKYVLNPSSTLTYFMKQGILNHTFIGVLK